MSAGDLRIGIALSGGGVRAAVFHFGMLARIAEDSLLENITYVSTVSGGSLGMGLILAHSNNAFPSSKDYLEFTAPRLKLLLTSVELGKSYLYKVLKTPSLLLRRTATDFAKQIEEFWRVNMMLGELPSKPIWIINAACYETGKNWRFRKKRIGDYTFGYTEEVDFPVSAAIAASSAVPLLIGPLAYSAHDKEWFKVKKDRVSTYFVKPPHETVHLYDGALYDNLGLEAVMKREEEDLDFLIVSNGGTKIDDSPYRLHPKSYCRLIEIIYRRSVDMYSRSFVDHYLKCLGRKGRYFQFGNSAKYILHNSAAQSSYPNLRRKLAYSAIKRAKSLDIKRTKLSTEEFDILFLHGYEVANCTLHGHDPEGFDLKPNFPEI